MVQIMRLERQRGILAELLLRKPDQPDADGSSVKTVTSKLRSVCSI